MKAIDWGKVKPGTILIYASEYEGIFRAKVLETDIRLYEPGEPSVWSYPYGLTKDTGTIRIQYDEAEAVVNLADMIRYSQDNLQRLETAWKKYQAYVDYTETYRGQLTSLISDLKER